MPDVMEFPPGVTYNIHDSVNEKGTYMMSNLICLLRSEGVCVLEVTLTLIFEHQNMHSRIAFTEMTWTYRQMDVWTT